jgi:hypothetical protein
VREALTVRSTAGTDQQAMVRDLCQGGAGVAVVAAVAAYQARNRVVAADSKPAATLNRSGFLEAPTREGLEP